MVSLDYYEIGQRIRRIRKANGLSQEELAGKVDISTTHMSHIETGNTKLSLPVLVDIASALEVGTDDLLNGNHAETSTGVLGEIAAVLERCTAKEARIIADLVRATKRAMDIHLNNGQENQ